MKPSIKKGDFILKYKDLKRVLSKAAILHLACFDKKLLHEDKAPKKQDQETFLNKM